MASNEVEVLDPAATVEKLSETTSGVLNRRSFIAGLGVAGAAVGAALLSEHGVSAQQPSQNGFTQVDVLNFLLNIKYLLATFYKTAIYGGDLPASFIQSQGGTVGMNGEYAQAGKLYYNPTPVVFSGSNAAQITDMLSEIYYDEINQLQTLINQINLTGTAVSRPYINVQGTGTPVTATTSNYLMTITGAQALGIARLIEDVSVSACAGAALYLTGSNLALVSQMLATDGFHAGALRLASIQNAAVYKSSSAVSSFLGSTIAGSTVSYASSMLGFTLASAGYIPTVGQLVTGAGIPKDTYITSVTGVPSATSSTNVITLAPTSVTLSGIITTGSPTITTVASFPATLAVGQFLTGTGVSSGATIIAINTTAKTITMSASATSQASSTPTGVVSTGLNTITGISTAPVAGDVGLPVTGTGIPAGTTLLTTGTTATMSNVATGQTNGTITGIVQAGSSVITGVSSFTGLVVGQPISGYGIPTGASITKLTTGTVNTATETITISAPATAGSTTIANQITPTASAPTATFTSGSSTLIVSSLAGGTGTTAISTALNVGTPISGAGIPAGATIVTAGSVTGTGNVITISAATTAAGTNVPLTIPIVEYITVPAAETITVPAAQTITVITGTISISNPATATGTTTITSVTADPMDVEPADPGSAAAAAAGPSALATSSNSVSGVTPTVYEGFFNTAGTATGSASNPAGFAFARTFTQALSVLYNVAANAPASVPTQYTGGGFFPNGMNGNIHAV